MKVLAIVDNDPDLAFLVETIFSMDPRFTVDAVTASAEEALASAQFTAEVAGSDPGIIVLDHGLAGALTGLDAAPKLKRLVPRAKIILFTAHAELEALAEEEPAIDAFLLKTEPTRLLAMAQQLTGLRSSDSGCYEPMMEKRPTTGSSSMPRACDSVTGLPQELNGIRA
jgi:DNA-binding NarL/FixJ family response regulator